MRSARLRVLRSPSIRIREKSSIRKSQHIPRRSPTEAGLRALPGEKGATRRPPQGPGNSIPVASGPPREGLAPARCPNFTSSEEPIRRKIWGARGSHFRLARRCTSKQLLHEEKPLMKREKEAFLEALAGLHAEALSACPGWTAHDVLAHVVAGGTEIVELVQARTDGQRVPATRGFEEREQPFRELPDPELRRILENTEVLENTL